MKNLKKVLSLALALVMAMSLMTTAFAADVDFTDADEITKTEAVETMAAIGLLEGSNGAFDPQGTLTREQAAKMITYMLLGTTDAEKQPTASVFADVAADRWSASYVAYCAEEGIIAGKNATTFDPTGKLTGYQYAKMLLCALGYDATEKGLVGDSWAINTGKYFVAEGLDVEGVDMNTELSRENAAQMTLNAMKWTGAEKSYGVDEDGDGIADKTFTDRTDALMYAMTGTYTYLGEVETAEGSLLDTVYGVDVVDGEDAFGRPGIKYVMNDEDGTELVYADAPALTFTASVDADDMAKALKNYKVGTSAVVIAKNTKDTFATDNTILQANLSATALETGESTAVAGLTGNGVTVEIYADSDKVLTKIVVIKPLFVQVAVDEIDETKTVGAYTKYTVDTNGNTAGGEVVSKVFSTVVNEDSDKTNTVITGNVADEDMVLFYQDKNGKTYISAVDSISGVLSTKTSDGVYTIGGSAYELAAASIDTPAVDKDSQEFYVDSFGYILGTKSAAVDATQYGFVIKADNFQTLDGNKVVENYTVTVALPDGTIKVLPVSSTTYATFSGLTGLATAVATYVTSNTPAVTYADANNDGEYEVTQLDANDSGDQAIYAKLTKIEKESTNLTTTGTTSVAYANAETKFLFVDYAENSDGARETTSTVTVYTGVKNVGNYDSTAAYAIDTDSTPDGIADVVFVLVDTTASVSGDYIYLIGTYTDTTDGRVWDTIVNGEASTLTTSTAVGLDESSTTATTLVAHTLYSKIVLDADSKITIGSGNTEPATTTDDKVQNKGGLLMVGDVNQTTYTVSETMPVYIIDKYDDSVVVKTFADITKAVESENNVYVTDDGTNYTAVYVITDSTPA